MFLPVLDSFKYALSMADTVMNVYGAHQAIGYDIGCSFSSTIRNSSLSAKALALFLELLVNAFHGHAHNRLCQLVYHPLFRKILGIEDLESCERIFSGSNPTARVIRHASHFHYVQFLDLHFSQWNEDRYLDLST